MRNKEKYNSIDDLHLVQCVKCGRMVAKKYYGIRNLYEDCDHGICAYCDWMRRHSGTIPQIASWSNDDVKRALLFLLNGESVYLNDLQISYPKRTLSEIYKLISQLQIKNRELLVRGHCTCCGKEISKIPSAFLFDQNNFCSRQCYHNYRTSNLLRGEDSPFYNRIVTACNNCGKTISLPPFRYNNVNQYGENHTFCSHQCYAQFRSKYYIGEKSSAFRRNIKPTTREKMRIASAVRCKHMKHLNSFSQQKVDLMLKRNDINFTREKSFLYYSVDNYLDDYNLFIEVMGNYWHSNPNIYNESNYPLTQKQLSGIQRDKEKHDYIKENTNKEILYLWETDILNNPELCELLILAYIDSNGELFNYHSFNYYVNDGKLTIRKTLITPYQNMDGNKYLHLLKMS